MHCELFSKLPSHDGVFPLVSRDLFMGPPGGKRSSSSRHDKLQSSYRLRRVVLGSIVDAITLRSSFTPPAGRQRLDQESITGGSTTRKNSLTGGRPGYFLVALYARITPALAVDISTCCIRRDYSRRASCSACILLREIRVGNRGL